MWRTAGLALIVGLGCGNEPAPSPAGPATPPPPALSISSSYLDVGEVAAGEVASGLLWLSNDGGRPATVHALVVAPEAWTATLSSPIVHPGDEAELWVAYHGDGSESADGTLTVSSDDPARPEIVVTLAARGPAATDETSDTAPTQADPVDTAMPDVVAPARDQVFDTERVHTLDVQLSEPAIASLRAEPTEQVEGRIVFDGTAYDDVAVRLKGSASFQDIDRKPAWKLEFDEYVEGGHLFGLERLTLNNEVWDPTMMAETYAYRVYRENGSPAPLTGYASVTLNGELLGLYAIIESMDDDFVDRVWPGSNGGLWEMTRDCDFDGDCSCFELQETGGAYVEGAIAQGCSAVTAGTLEALDSAFDWDAILAFLAVEIAVNHPDSYGYNLNNFFVYHDPPTDQLSLSPWGADSTFVYEYPASLDNPDCEPQYRDVFTSTPKGWLRGFCDADATCRADLAAKVLEVADWLEGADLATDMQRTAALLDPHAELETHVNWTVEDRQDAIACFTAFVEERPEALRAEVATW